MVPGRPFVSGLAWTSNRTSSSTRTGISWNFEASSRFRGASPSAFGALLAGDEDNSRTR